MHHAHKQKYPITGGHRPVATPLDERDKNYVQVVERFGYKDLQPQMYAEEQREKEKRVGLQLILHWLENHGPATMPEIAAGVGVTPSAIQHHISRSNDRFVSVGRRQGTGSPKLWIVAK